MKNSDPVKTTTRGIHRLKELWPEMPLFERFEYIVMLFVSFVLAIIILVALFRLVENVYQLAVSQIIHKTEFRAFQTTFGMLLTLLIAFEFRNSINAVIEGKGLIIQAQIIVLIAIIALARKFLVLDPKEYEASMLAAYACIALSLGVIYWIISARASGGDELVRRL